MDPRLRLVKKLEDGTIVESHALWNFGRKHSHGDVGPMSSNLHPWRSHYPVDRTGVHAPRPAAQAGLLGLIPRSAKQRSEVEQPMALPIVHSTGDEVAGEAVAPRVRRYPYWIGPDGNFDPRHIAWACPDCARQTVLGDLLDFLRRPLDLLKRWLR